MAVGMAGAESLIALWLIPAVERAAAIRGGSVRLSVSDLVAPVAQKVARRSNDAKAAVNMEDAHHASPGVSELRQGARPTRPKVSAPPVCFAAGTEVR